MRPSSLALLAFATLGLIGQDAPRPNTNPDQPRGKNIPRLPAALSPDEQEKLQAAMEKARQNPAVKEANEQAEQKEQAAMESRRKARELTEDAARQADPSVAPILEKLRKALDNNRNRQPTPDPRANEGRNNNQPRPPQGEPRANDGRKNAQPEDEPKTNPGRNNRQPNTEPRANTRDEPTPDRAPQTNQPNVSPDEQKRLREALNKAMQDPDVKAAHEAAATAQKKARELAHAAALKADPSLAPLLEKMKAGGEPRRAEGEGQRGRKQPE